jgi:hypothetical protein
MKKHKLILNGMEVTEEEFHRDGKIGGPGIPMITRTCTPSRPWITDALGVLPNQVAEERIRLAERQQRGHLTAVRILDNGAVECTDPGDAGRMGWIKHRSAVDADGGYRETYNSRT